MKIWICECRTVYQWMGESHSKLKGGSRMAVCPKMILPVEIHKPYQIISE